MNKPGYKSTEFWVTVLVQVVGVIAALGLVTPDQSDTLVKAVIQGGGIIGMLLSAFGYAKSRAAVKSAEAQAEGMKRLYPPDTSATSAT